MKIIKVGASGAGWGDSTTWGIYYDWGECGVDNVNYEKTYKMLGEMLVDYFHEIAAQNNSSAQWNPKKSEVMVDDNEPENLTEKYLDWRKKAATEIRQKYIDGEIKPIMNDIKSE